MRGVKDNTFAGSLFLKSEWELQDYRLSLLAVEDRDHSYHSYHSPKK